MHGLKEPRLLATTAVIAVIPHSEITAAARDHTEGNWTGLTAAQIRENHRALAYRTGQVFSVHTFNGRKFHIQTDIDTGRTTVALSDEI